MDLTYIAITLIGALKLRNISQSIFIEWINARNCKGYTALHLSSFRGNIEIICALIDVGANYLLVNDNGLGVLHLAIQGDQPAAILYFYYKYKMDLNVLDTAKSTLLHWACYSGAENAFNYLLALYDKETNTSVFNSQDHEGITPLHLAVLSGKHYFQIRKI